MNIQPCFPLPRTPGPTCFPMVRRPVRGRMLISTIQRTVAEFYCIPALEMKSKRCSRSIARPRQIAMYLARDLTPQSLPDIGRRFGNRDHTTVMHAIRVVDRLREQDEEFDTEVRFLFRLLSTANSQFAVPSNNSSAAGGAAIR